MTSRTATPAAGAPPRSRGRRPGPLARVASDARVAWAVAMVLAAVLGVVSILFAPLVIAERDREEVASVAAVMAARLATFSSGDLEAWAQSVSALATDAYAEEVDALLDESLRTDMDEADVTSQGQVVDLHVQHLDSSEARVFVVVLQRASGAGSEEAAESTVRMTLGLRRTGGGWLVDAVSVLPDPAPFTLPGAP